LAGLPGDQSVLAEDQTLRLAVPDRDPATRFPGTGFVLPRVEHAGLPVETVNVDTLEVRIYRVNDRALVSEIRNGMVFGDLYNWALDDLADNSGELVWQGQMTVDNVANQSVRTAIPIGETIGTLEPGIYAAAAVDQREMEAYWQDWASQWFVVSDLGLSSYLGGDGLDVTARSLADGTQLAGATIELYARNSQLLGQATTDADGLARLDAGLVRGTGGNTPRVVVARLGEDFAFIDLAMSALDLSDRGVEGRLPPGPLDAFLYSERGIYRPGETAHVMALLRDDRSVAVTGLSLILRVVRPDGVEVSRSVVADAGQGGHPLDIALPGNAYTGRWTVEALADPSSPAIGSVTFLVDDFVPPRIEFDLTADPEMLTAADAAGMAVIDADYLYGGVAAGLEGELTLTYGAERDPLNLDNGFAFGLIEEDLAARSPEPVAFTTDAEGRAEVPLDLADMPATSSPVAVELQAQIFDVGGRPVGRDGQMTVLSTDLLIGIRPLFDTYVRRGEEAAFEVGVWDDQGNRVARNGLAWNLVREGYEWRWWDDGGNWRYRGFLWDDLVAYGSLDAGTESFAGIAREIDWGRYRLNIYDPESGAATSVRFRSGWSRGPVAGDSPPDRVTVTLSQERFSPGQSVTVFIDPPFDAQVALAVMDDSVREMRFVAIPDEGAEVTLTAALDWAPGAYVVATAYGAPDPLVPSIPQRAVGVAWMSIDRDGQALAVTIEAPEAIEPEQTVDVAVAVGEAVGGSAFVTLAAVDDGILQLTRYTAPDPSAWFLGQRRLGVAISDLYGRLIDATGAASGEIRSGGDRSGGGLGDALAKRSSKVVALFSGVVPVVDGIATVPLPIPDFNGRLRLMAVAWSAGGVGQAETTMTVAAPVVADLVLPRFLAPGDRSLASLAIDNVSGPAGSYRFQLIAEGPVAVLEPATVLADLAQGQRIEAGFRLEANALGVAQVMLAVSGPDDFYQERTWDLSVRAPTSVTTERLLVDLGPGATYLLGPALTAGFLEGDLAVSMVADTSPPIDAAALLRWLYLYPYGCAEQTASTAMPLLYLDRLDPEGTLTDVDPDERDERIVRAIRRLAAMQRSDGDFGLWSWHGTGSTWLTAYVTDFLSRAQDKGYFVSQSALAGAYEALERALDGDGTSAARAYALHVLARNGQGDPYELAYAADRLSRNASLSRIGRALLAAAFAELGDPVRARETFGLADAVDDGSSDYDLYGSPLRDSAMAEALLIESGIATPAEIGALAADVARHSDLRYWWTSTQEKAWLVIVAAASQSDAPVAVAVDRVVEENDGAVRQTLAWPPADTSTPVTNMGETPLYLSVAWAGYPRPAAPAAADGLTIERAVFDMQGTPIAANALHQHQRVVVVLKVKVTDTLTHNLMVVDLLPAGLELENARLEGSIETRDLSWLPELAELDQVELRDDRYLAALELWRAKGTATLAYVARAVTPGHYVVPAPFVEDMYRPYYFARGEAGALVVSAP
ncbi:MAG: alpha-2-macroglobulin, partial [Proteobacteria bacterium]|nr:alpha-2-macroglobulin [Pseudomonadota bacterium]